MRWWMPLGLVVALGAWSLHAPAGDAPKRIWSKGFTTWIHAEAKKSSRRLGYVRIGDSVKLKTGQALKGQGCATAFYEVEPHGFVCHDRTSSLALEGRYLKAMQLARAKRALRPTATRLRMARRCTAPAESGGVGEGGARLRRGR
jgi:hypothetical protein